MLESGGFRSLLRTAWQEFQIDFTMAISLDLLIMKGEGEEKEKQLEHTQTDGNEAIPSQVLEI